jgi:hypothetical protein
MCLCSGSILKRLIKFDLRFMSSGLIKIKMKVTYSIYIVTYSWFSWLIRRGLDLKIEFNWTFIQQVTTVHKPLSDTHLFWLDSVDFWPHSITPLYSVPSFDCTLFITPRHGPHGKHRLLLSRMCVYWSITQQWMPCCWVLVSWKRVCRLVP